MTRLERSLELPCDYPVENDLPKGEFKMISNTTTTDACVCVCVCVCATIRLFLTLKTFNFPVEKEEK